MLYQFPNNCNLKLTASPLHCDNKHFRSGLIKTSNEQQIKLNISIWLDPKGMMI